MTEETIHGCAVVWGRHGILVLGESGSGKSSLVHEMVLQSSDCLWVADDRVMLSTHYNAVVARAPQNLAEKAEQYGIGIVAVDALRATRIDLVVRLVAEEDWERLPEDTFAQPFEDGPKIPLLMVPKQSTFVSCRLVQAQLKRI